MTHPGSDMTEPERTVTFRRQRLLPAPPARLALPAPSQEPAPAAQPRPKEDPRTAPWHGRKPAPVTFASDRREWERQPRESAVAHAAWEIYRKMPAEGRRSSSVAAAVRKSSNLIRRWMTRWRWPDRARAYDAEIMRLEQEKTAAEEAAYRGDLLRRRRDAVELHERVGRRMVSTAAARLTGGTFNGQTVAALPIESLDAADVAAFARQGVNITREALGLPTGPHIEATAGAAAGPDGAAAVLRIVITDSADGSEEVEVG